MAQPGAGTPATSTFSGGGQIGEIDDRTWHRPPPAGAKNACDSVGQRAPSRKCAVNETEVLGPLMRNMPTSCARPEPERPNFRNTRQQGIRLAVSHRPLDSSSIELLRQRGR